MSDSDRIVIVGAAMRGDTWSGAPEVLVPMATWSAAPVHRLGQR